MQSTQTKRAPRGGRPTKEHAERLAARIEAAARELFITQGFAATTMEQIIAACGIGKDTLYRRFSTKEELFAAIADKARLRTLERFESHDAESPRAPLERVRHLARWFLDANLDEELLALKREAFIEAMRARPLVQEDQFTPRLVEAISRARDEGALDVPDAGFAAQQLLAAVVLGPSNDALMGSTALADPDARAAWFDRAWALFVEGAGAR